MTYCRYVNSSGHATGLDYSKYNEWDAKNASPRSRPITSSHDHRSSFRQKLYQSSVCCHHVSPVSPICSHRQHSRHRHRSAKSQRRSSSSASCDSYQSERVKSSSRHQRHHIAIDQYRHRDRSRLASARQSAFSVLSQTSAAVAFDHKRRHRNVSNSDDSGTHNIAALKAALSKVGRRNQVQSDRNSVRRSALSQLIKNGSEAEISKGSDDGSKDQSRTIENEIGQWTTAVLSDQGTDLAPFMSGNVLQQSKLGTFWPGRKRFLVLRRTCLEIYDSETAYEMGTARSCMLLVGARTNIVHGTCLKIDSCGKSKQFRISSNDEVMQWVEQIEMIVRQLTPVKLSHFR